MGITFLFHFFTSYSEVLEKKMVYPSPNMPVMIFRCNNLMNNVFSKYWDKFVLVFLDDIIIYLRNDEEHGEHLRMVLQFIIDN